ncbi:phage tail tape measure, family, core region domain protein [Burkholderia pseudomallei MSHR5596]|nr:phage tail tape measure, family, core region domain protein [Burkholderia pseudomallei MSHR5596]
MKEAIGKGWSTLEASFVLARAYIERVDPAKAKQLAEAAKSINAELDPAKRQKQIRAFEETMKTGDLFTDMQVKAALTAYMQNADIYQKMKRNGADISGQIQKDLDDRRETSRQIWKEVVDQWDDAMRSIGDALRPVTDLAGEQAKQAGGKVRDIVDSSPRAAAAVIGVAGAAIAYRGARAAWSIGRGVLDVARGARMARGGGGKGGKGAKPGRGGQALDALGAAASGVQRVFVVNLPGGGIGGGSVGDLIESAAGATTGKAGRGGRFGRLGRALGGIVGRVLPYAGKIALAGTVLKVGLAAKDAYAVAAGDDTRARKAENFAGIGGSLAGGVVGAKLGASIGAFGGPIGAAIGGVTGGAIGSFAGQKLLGALARWMAQRRGDEPAAARAVANAKALVAPGVAERRAFKVEQQNSFAPVFHIKLDGGSDQAMADRLLARINPQIQRAMTQSMDRNNRSALFDAPHL